jgi:small subunit ribosomal protein S4
VDVKNWLDRRLQTVLFKKGLTNTVSQARQMIVHKKVLVDGNVVNIPSFFVTTELESKIDVKATKPKKIVPKEEKTEEATEAKAEESQEEVKENE